MKRGDATEHPLVLGLKLYEEELAVHGDVLELAAVGQYKVGVELQAALAEAAKDPNDAVGVEEDKWGHAYTP